MTLSHTEREETRRKMAQRVPSREEKREGSLFRKEEEEERAFQVQRGKKRIRQKHFNAQRGRRKRKIRSVQCRACIEVFLTLFYLKNCRFLLLCDMMPFPCFSLCFVSLQGYWCFIFISLHFNAGERALMPWLLVTILFCTISAGGMDDSSVDHLFPSRNH